MHNNIHKLHNFHYILSKPLGSYMYILKIGNILIHLVQQLLVYVHYLTTKYLNYLVMLHLLIDLMYYYKLPYKKHP